jgi:hypothetical protein
VANLFSKFLGRTASEGAAFAFGVATAPVLHPAVRELENLAWAQYQSRPLDAGAAAAIVAEDVEQAAWGAGEASQTGVNQERFNALLGEALNAPGIGELYELWRRGEITDADFAHGLRKGKLEPRWDAPLKALHDVLLSPADLSNAVVQGHMGQDAAAAEAALQGYTADRFNVLVENTGLPPGPETLLAWLRRGIIDQGEFEQGVREGHTKTKYIPFYEAARAPLLSAATAVRLYLKGWYTKAQRDALGAQWGYSSQQMEDWFLSEGRPATPHQIHIGYARGATLPGAANEEDAIRTSVKQSDVRPEYADLIYAGRYTLPSAFALRGLVTSGDLTAAEGQSILVDSGWPPDLATKVADSWAKTTAAGTTENPYVSKADNQLWTALHKAFVKIGAPQTEVEPLLTHIVPDGVARAAVFADWNLERQANTLAAPTA